jgi:ATP synthase protein I
LSFTTPSDVFSQMLKIQLIAVIVLAAVLWVVFGLNASISAILGGMSVILGAYAASLVSKKKVNTQDASAVLINLLKAEAVKIVVIVVLLLIIFKTFTALVPFALIAGLAATALFSGAALSKLNV